MVNYYSIPVSPFSMCIFHRSKSFRIGKPVWIQIILKIFLFGPMTPALIRMGDLLYEGQRDGQKDLSSAAALYTLAARRNTPQVCCFEMDFSDSVCIHCVQVCFHSYCSSTGMVQPWPPCWGGLQAATVSIDWPWPFRAVLGRQQFDPEHFVQKVFSEFYVYNTSFGSAVSRF